MTRKAILVLAVIAAIVIAMTLSGCTTPVTTTATPTPGGEGTPAPTTSGTGTAAGGSPTVTYDGDNFKITGSKGGNVKANLKEGGYVIEFRHKGYSFNIKIGTMNLKPGGQYPDATTGWAQFATVEKIYSGGETEFTIEAEDQYEVNFKKLPLSASGDAVPRTYTEKGLKVVGPMSLKAGQVNLKISAPDLNKAGFTVDLVDATTGTSGAYSVPPGIESNKIDTTLPLTLDADGDYLLEVSANGNTGWTIEVSQ